MTAQGKRQAQEVKASVDALRGTLDSLHEQLERLHQTATERREFGTVSAAMSMMLEIDDAEEVLHGGR